MKKSSLEKAENVILAGIIILVVVVVLLGG